MNRLRLAVARLICGGVALTGLPGPRHPVGAGPVGAREVGATEDTAMHGEFDTMAVWTADAVAALGPDHAMPAACRGSGSPAVLAWLADRLELGPGTRLLDCGAGVGGPAQYAVVHHGVRPLLVDPMRGACRASVRLFDLPVAVGDGGALPVRDDTFDAVWSLGVLCTVEDKTSHLGEMARALRPGGLIGLLVFLRVVDELPDRPEGNHFPTDLELATALRAAGLTVLDQVRVDDLAACPDDWQDRADGVSAWIEREHDAEDSWRSAAGQQRVVTDLLASGLVVGQLLTCRAGSS